MYRKRSGVHLTQFSGEFFDICLFQLGNGSHILRIQDVAPSVAADLIVSVIILVLIASSSLARAPLSSVLTCTKATMVRVFLWSFP